MERACNSTIVFKEIVRGIEDSGGDRLTRFISIGTNTINSLTTFPRLVAIMRTMDHEGEVLILTGPPGSGKTTTAQALSELPGAAKVHLHADDFWHFIKNGAIPPYMPAAHQQNAVVVDVLAKVVAGYVGGGYFVTLDGIVGPWFLDCFTTIEAPFHYVVLRPPLDVAIERCRRRGGDTLTDPEPITALYQQFSSLGPFERHVVQTQGYSRKDTLDAVVTAMRSGKFRIDSMTEGMAK